MAKTKKKKQESNSGRFQWFFFVIIVPVIFAITLTIVVLTIMGFNVFDEAAKIGQKIPGVSNVVTTEEEKSGEQEIASLEATVADYEAQIQELEGTVSSRDNEIEELKQEIATLESSISEEEENSEEAETTDSVGELAGSFEEMDAERAAALSENMDTATIVQILREVSSEARGEILAEMDPEIGATIAERLAVE
ncbi:MotE family protein [Salimicrobium halophilum]|uniref:Flagellar motility protein MotE, a chaperone for MotC folding n=1 Tax=Salimicrobium halophilum TaxID=86666 RepID=A0A1G8QB68_9BACI|nr:hypothetical protein [Salimicrobium halophilum]SDJ01838.1 Flagellar motility protein MotE, a chaperone for MotC folding [Salimicrobium halophilum]